MGTHPIFESDFDCLTEWQTPKSEKNSARLLPMFKEQCSIQTGYICRIAISLTFTDSISNQHVAVATIFFTCQNRHSGSLAPHANTGPGSDTPTCQSMRPLFNMSKKSKAS